MAKERNLPSKATLTTSDFIRVVGSDNASYKQRVDNVMGAMGVYTLTYGYTNPQVSAFSELKDSGFYTIGSASSYSDAPVNTYGFLAVFHGGTYVTQTYYALGLSDSPAYFRFSTNNGSAWSAWTKEPTRAEIDALNSKRVFLNWGNTLTFTLPTGHQALVLVGNTELHILWNPADSLNQNVVWANGGTSGTTISRGSSITEVVISRATNSTISVLIM